MLDSWIEQILLHFGFHPKLVSQRFRADTTFAPGSGTLTDTESMSTDMERELISS